MATEKHLVQSLGQLTSDRQVTSGFGDTYRLLVHKDGEYYSKYIRPSLITAGVSAVMDIADLTSQRTTPNLDSSDKLAVFRTGDSETEWMHPGLIYDSIPNDAIVGDMIATGAVVEAKLGNGAVTNAKMANASVDTANIVADAIDKTKVEAGTLYTSHNLASLTSGNITTTDPSYNTIYSYSITPGANDVPVSILIVATIGCIGTTTGSGLCYTTAELTVSGTVVSRARPFAIAYASGITMRGNACVTTLIETSSTSSKTVELRVKQGGLSSPQWEQATLNHVMFRKSNSY